MFEIGEIWCRQLASRILQFGGNYWLYGTHGTFLGPGYLTYYYYYTLMGKNEINFTWKNFTIMLVTDYCYGDQITKCAVGKSCSMRGTYEIHVKGW